MSLATLLAFSFAMFLLAASPGPGFLMVVARALTGGFAAGLAAIAGIKADRSKSCQIATTVTRIGKSVYDSGAHGEAGATVTISPSLPAAHGPIYFNAQVLPEPTLKATTSDGGVIFVNVPPGQYTITAQKAGVKFRPIKIKCRVGWLANAAPPWGVQAIK